MESYGKLMFTGAVRDEQARDGMAEKYAKLYAKPRFPEITVHEKDFIETRTSFYLASVSATGWPYVQHRGGPVGFLKVLGPEQIAFADYPGNRQYITIGNLQGDTRISLFVMDYPRKARLKLQGTVAFSEDAGVLAQLTAPDGIAPSRAYVITVVGMDWNCPKYIEPRYTEAEIEQMIGPKMQEMAARIAELEAKLAERR